MRTIAGVLLLTLLLSAVLTYWNAISKVETEVGSAIDMAEKTVRKAIPEIARDDDPRLELVRLVRVFDGNRHVKASFVEVELPASGFPARWRRSTSCRNGFSSYLRGLPRSCASSFPRHSPPTARSSSRRRFAARWPEVWDDVVLKLTILTVFCILVSVLVYVTIGRALGPITGLLGAFERLGNGDYRARVDAKGPTEIEKLCDGFNAMAQRLGTWSRETAGSTSSLRQCKRRSAPISPATCTMR